MLAAVLAMASCDSVLTHTGNVGAWTAIYRGSAHNLYQFDAAGALLARLQPPESRAGVSLTGVRLLGTWMPQDATVPITTMTRNRRPT